jgi:hypothetical protein
VGCVNAELRNAVMTYGNDLDSLADGFRNVVRVAALELDKADARAVAAEERRDREIARREQAEKELAEYVEGAAK